MEISTKRTKSSTPAAPAAPDFSAERLAAERAEAHTLENLERIVIAMDAMSNEAFEQIAAIAQMSLIFMETTTGQISTETVAQGLKSISAMAERAGDAVSAFAHETDGCWSQDLAQERRMEAALAARGVVLRD